MQILIIDNNIMPDSWGARELVRYARAVPGATVRVRRAPHGDLPEDPAAFDAIVVSGSMTSANETQPWIDELLAFIRRAVELDKPYLGVCYGHQMLNRALAGEQTVRKAERGEFGWAKIRLTGESPLFTGMPREFHSFASHHDEVHELAPGMRKLAESDICPIQACQLGERPIFGVQFHPERDADGALHWFTEQKKKNPTRPLLRPRDTTKIFDAKVGERIFANFFALAPSDPKAAE
jgi:GMP synthase (glutamine-hydrolysing)